MKTEQKKMTVEYFKKLETATPEELIKMIGIGPDDRALDAAELTLLVVNLLHRIIRADARCDAVIDRSADNKADLKSLKAHTEGLNDGNLELFEKVATQVRKSADLAELHFKAIQGMRSQIDWLEGANTRLAKRLKFIEGRHFDLAERVKHL